MEQLSLLANETEVYADQVAQGDNSSVVVAAHKRHTLWMSYPKMCL